MCTTQYAPNLQLLLWMRRSPVRYFRKQFPLELAHGSAYHKAQGITLTDKHATVMPRESPMVFGGEYVAVLRVTDLEHLHLTRAVTADHFTNHEPLRSQFDGSMKDNKHCMFLSIQDVTIKNFLRL